VIRHFLMENPANLANFSIFRSNYCGGSIQVRGLMLVELKFNLKFLNSQTLNDTRFYNLTEANLPLTYPQNLALAQIDFLCGK